MQIYAMRLFNFLRFGENNNSIVFDLSDQDKIALENKTISMDEIYDRVMKNPLEHIKQVKERGVEKMLGITGIIDGDPRYSNGSGKCFGAGTKVLMFDGTIKKVEDICVGDLLMGVDSTPRKVLSTHDGVDKLYEVKQHRKNSYIVNSKHDLIFKTKDKKYNRYKNCGYAFSEDKLTYKISVDEYLEKSRSFRHLMGGVQSGAIEFREKSVRIDPYILGIWLGDGYSVGSSFANIDKEIIDCLQTEANKRGLSFDKRGKCGYHIHGNKNMISSHCKKTLELQEHGKTYKEISKGLSTIMPQYKNGQGPSEISICRWLKKAKSLKESSPFVYDSSGFLNIRSKNSLKEDLKHYDLLSNKHIPNEYKINSKEVRLNILAGLIDTDGYLDNGYFEIVSKYETLARDIAFLARSLGFFANIRSCMKKCCNNGVINKYWRVSFWGDINKIPTKLKRKMATKKLIKKNHLTYKIEVVPCGIGKYYGFEIDGDHLFMLDDFTVVHNSTMMDGICYAHYEKIVRKTANTDKVEKAGLSVVTKIDGKYPKNLQESYVEELFDDNGKVFRLKRGRTFAKNQKTSTPLVEFEYINKNEVEGLSGHRSNDTRNAIEDIITMDYDCFVNSQMFGQNDSGKFLMGTDKTKKEMLINLLKLENVVAGCLELIRNKKNAQNKKVTNLQSSIGLLEEMLLEIYARVMQKNKDQLVFEPSFVDAILSNLNLQYFQIQKEASAIDKEISDNAKKLEELNKSEKISVINSIREDGKKLQAERKSKEQEMLNQIGEWKRMVKETNDSKEEKTTQKNKFAKEAMDFQTKIDAKQNEINIFDQAAYDKNMEMVKRAKEAKPKFEEKLSTLTKARDAIVSEVGRLKGEIKSHDNIITKLNAQIKGMGSNNKLTCSECLSVVSSEHVVSKINENSEARKIKEEQLIVSNKLSDENNTEIQNINGKMKRVNEYLVMEAKLIAAKAAVKENEKNIEELKKQKVKYEELEVFVGKEIEALIAKEKEYANKCIALEKIFEKDVEDIQNKINILIERLKNAEEDAKEVKAQIEKFNVRQKTLADNKNKLMERMGSIGKEKERVDKDKITLNAKREELKKDSKLLERLEFLEEVFGLDGIQTRIVKKYLPLLNVYIKEFLDILSEGSINVKMIINDKSKVDMVVSGGTSDVYEMLSGGEKKIIKLAVSIGMSLLAFSKSAQKPEIICLDEIFADLDESRTTNTFSLLKRLTEKFSRVLVISHKPSINERIEHHIVIEKDPGISGMSRITKIT